MAKIKSARSREKSFTEAFIIFLLVNEFLLNQVNNADLGSMNKRKGRYTIPLYHIPTNLSRESI
jgi:hypothetical protein